MKMLASALLLLSATAAAANGDGAVLALSLDNDQFTPQPTDRYYTNGLRLSLRGPAGSRPFWGGLGMDRLPIWPQGALLVPETGFSQLMFTPSRYDRPAPAPGDRPYAGMAALSMGYTGIGPRTGDGPQRIDQLTLTIGIIGPLALAGEAQRLVHRIGGFRQPQGWATQLGTEPAVNLAWRRGWRFGGERFDVTPHVGAALGNVHIQAQAGATLRLGAGLAAEALPGAIDGLQPMLAGLPNTQRLTVHVLAGVDARAVARNLFIDGNSFTSGRGATRVAIVGEARAGIVARWRRAQISWVHHWRAKEFTGQAGIQRYGSITLAVGL